MLLISVKQQQQKFISTTATTTIYFKFTSNETLTTFLKEFNYSMNRH